MTDFSVKFVSKKINKIRWRPKADVKSPPSTTFATGSWDDQQNSVCLWKIHDRIASVQKDNPESALEHEPQKVAEKSHVGDVLDMQYVSRDHLVVASSTGDVTLMKHCPITEYASRDYLDVTSLTGDVTMTKYRPNKELLNTVFSWENVHHFASGANAPCTCLATRGDDWIATSGEDGHIVIVAIGQKHPVQTIEKADSCTINALTFLKQSEILAVNSFGQLKTFDLRQASNKQTQIFSVTENHVPLLCADKHPGQEHIVATGGGDGMLTIWDLRQEKFPMTLLEAHSGPMWEVKFHPHNPNHLFTCSDDGSLWHWDGSAFTSDLLPGFLSSKGKDTLNKTTGGITSPWLSLETSRHKLDIASLLPNKSLPVNSLDIESSTLLCGTDSETIYTIQLPMLN